MADEMSMTDQHKSEPWLRCTLTEMPVVHRAVLHALQLAAEDLVKWCGDLNHEELNTAPGGAASVAFHVRHIARSIDRLLTYAEGRQLADEQMVKLKDEAQENAVAQAVFDELRDGMKDAERRVRALQECDLEQARTVGRRSLPTTVGGLLVHIAEHTQRHVGQAITTAKIVRSIRQAGLRTGPKAGS